MIDSLLYQNILKLAPISEVALNELFHIATYRKLAKGEVLLNDGQVCKSIFFIETGYLRTFMRNDGKEINTDFAFENSFTTNIKSLRSETASTVTIQAAEPTTVYEFDKNELLQLYNKSPELESFGRKLLEHLLIQQEEHSNLFKIYSPKERYQYVQANYPELLQRVSLTQLASFLGTARETLSRIRKNP